MLQWNRRLTVLVAAVSALSAVAGWGEWFICLHIGW
jgi:hypothetical protein